MSKKLVLFDLDGTLLQGMSSEHTFMLFLLRRGYISCKQWFSALYFFIRWFPRFKSHVFIQNKAYLAGVSTQEIQGLAQQFVSDRLLKKIRSSLRARVEAHRKQGDIVILLTGSFDFLAKALSTYLDIPYYEATICSIKDQVFTALPPIQHPFHQEKLNIAQKLCTQFGVSLKDCVAYGNSNNDLPLLEQVGYPVAVHPARKLRRIAQAKGWEIIE